MSFEKSKCSFINKFKAKEEQIVADSVVSLENPNEISKIFWINTQAEIETVEPLTKEISFSGKVFFEMVYLTNENEIKVAKASSTFINKLINEKVVPSSKITIIPNIIEAKYLENFEKIQAVIGLNCEIYSQSEVEIVNSGDENICIKDEEITSQNFLQCDCITFNNELNSTLSNKVKNILSVRSRIITKNTEIEENLFVASGDIETIVQYTNNDEIPKIEKVTFIEPYKREIEVIGLTENSLLDTNIHIKQDTYTFEYNEETNDLTINLEIVICYKAIENVIIPFAVDIYSLKNNLEITTTSFEKTRFLNPILFEQKIDGVVTIKEEEPRIDKLIGFSNGTIKTTNEFIENGNITIEGLIQLDVVYLNDEQQDYFITSVELPYQITENTNINNTAEIFTITAITDLDISARHGREIYIDSKIKAYVEIFEQETDAIISDVYLTEPLPQKDYSIEIYFGKKGDNIWDISKELKIKPEQIIIQNPELILPLETNQNIVVYNQKKSDEDFG